MVERLLGTRGHANGIGQMQLANTLVDSVNEDGIWELRLSWCAVSQELIDTPTVLELPGSTIARGSITAE